MASFLPLLFILFCCLSSSFISSSAHISRKELRSKDQKEPVLGQSSDLVHSTRIDPSRVVQLSWQPRVFVYRGFLSDEECDHLISLASGKTNQAVNTGSSPGADVKDEVVARVEEKISAWTLLPLENSRPLQVLHYGNEEPKQKYDYYGNESVRQVSEPLMATVILYLSDASHGGELFFPKAQIITPRLKSKVWPFSAGHYNLLRPSKGNAILFFNARPNATPDNTSHHVRHPVLDGDMWCATKFFHIRATGEMKLPSETENSDCTDEDESCPQWAALGECKRNPVFMVGSPDYYGTCRKSCKVC